MIMTINFLFSRRNNLDKISVPKIRANASALKMPADRRDYKTDFSM